MSRIGNSIINIPEGVTVEVKENLIMAKGKLGELSQKFDGVSFNITDSEISVTRNSDSKDHKSKHGLYRSLLNNMVIGVSDGFVKELELVGVGYRANSSGQKLDLSLGFSHTIVMNLPPEIKVEAINVKGQNPIIKLSSIDKQLLGHITPRFVFSPLLVSNDKFEISRGNCFSIIPPLGFSALGFVCFLTIFTPSTIALLLLYSTCNTDPDEPLFSPEITTTLSPFLILIFFITFIILLVLMILSS